MRILNSVLTEADLRPETRAALAALRAARLVQVRRGAHEIHEKAPNDIVTGTDVLVQNVLQHVLYEHQPDVAFLGEEGTPTVWADTRRVWLTDPICCSTHYAAAIPLFATNVALLEDGQIVSSAIANGGTGELCVAERGRGAWLIESTGLRSLQPRGGPSSR